MRRREGNTKLDRRQRQPFLQMMIFPIERCDSSPAFIIVCITSQLFHHVAQHVLFNLLPSFPMDGGRVFRAILTPKLGRLKATYIASRVGKLMAIIFGLIGFFSSPSQWILVAIAFFIFISAENEYRMVQAQEAAKQADFGPWAAFGANWLTPTEDDEDVVEVSPPPYERGRKSKTELRHENRNPFRR